MNLGCEICIDKEPDVTINFEIMNWKVNMMTSRITIPKEKDT